MFQTKLICDNNSNYLHRHTKKESEISQAIEKRWWQIETHPGTITICQPITTDQIKKEAKHACCAECAQAIILQWSNESITDSVAEVPDAASRA